MRLYHRTHSIVASRNKPPAYGTTSIHCFGRSPCRHHCMTTGRSPDPAERCSLNRSWRRGKSSTMGPPLTPRTDPPMTLPSQETAAGTYTFRFCLGNTARNTVVSLFNYPWTGPPITLRTDLSKALPRLESAAGTHLLVVWLSISSEWPF